MMKKESAPAESLERNSLLDLTPVLEAMDMHWWYWDASERRLTMDAALIRLLGYSEEEFDPSIPTFDRNVHPEDSAENRQVFKEFLEGRSDVYEMEYRLRVNGKWCWYYNRGAIIKRNPDGTPYMAGGITMNISDRYSRMLGKAQEGTKFEFVFENTNEAVLIAEIGTPERRGLIEQVNPAAARLFACEQKDLEGKDPYELLVPHLEKRRDELKGILLDSGNLRIDVETKDLQGNDKFLEVNTHSFKQTGRDLYIAILTDKTESHRIQKELEASEMALRKSEKIYRSLIQTATDRIGIFEVGGEPVLLNNAFYETLGYTSEEFLGERTRENIHPDDRIELENLAGQLFERGFTESEYRVKHKDGHYLHMSSKSVLLQDAEFEKDYILFIIRDISDRVAFQKELVKAKEKAEESDQLKSAFLANMSHEIRTPMNSIVGFASLLTDNNLDVPSRKEYVSRINRNSEQLLTLISDIIDLAKIESNQLSVNFTNVILDYLFCELTAYGMNLLDQKAKTEVTIEYDPDEEYKQLVIESDLVRLTQILQNLVNNAVKFTSSGKIIVGFRVVDEHKVCLYVKDTGTGIDRQHFDLIFDQFRQVDGSNIRKYGGTGLGLAICRHLSTLLKGRIWVESEVGEGSSFFVELPIKSGYKIEPTNGVAGERTSEGSWSNLLVVDDDPDSLMLIVTMLRNDGYHVKTANSGYRALEILQQDPLPDVVLMDIQMPVLSGPQTLKILREMYPDLPVIAQTAHAMEGEDERSLAAGFNSYISKPYSKQALIEKINSVAGH